MSIAFNATTTKDGLVQFYEKEIGVDYGDISGNEEMLRSFCADTKEAFDEFFDLALTASGKWQLDDSNHTTKFPAIYANLVAGTRAYNITADADGNLPIDIYKAYARISATGEYQELHPVDQQSDPNMEGFYDGNDVQGIPTEYDKTGMTVYLKDIPSYNSTNGLKLLINREASYFVYNDTTKKPGVPGVLHAWFYIVPARKYARIHTLDSYAKLDAEYERLKKRIIARFGGRSKDEPKKIASRPTNNFM